jgi:hypothetical protein
MNSKYPHRFSKAAATYRKSKITVPNILSRRTVNGLKEDFVRQAYKNKSFDLIVFNLTKHYFFQGHSPSV